MSKASRREKEGNKYLNKIKTRIGEKCPRKHMTLKHYKVLCRELSMWGRKEKKYQRDYLSRPKMHLELKRYK